MSDVSPDLIEVAKSRDDRFKIIEEGFAIQAEVRNSQAVRHLLWRVKKDAELAMEELADVSPRDDVTVARLLVKVKTFVYIQKSLRDIQQRAEMHAQEIQAEDEAGLNEY